MHYNKKDSLSSKVSKAKNSNSTHREKPSELLAAESKCVKRNRREYTCILFRYNYSTNQILYYVELYYSVDIASYNKE